MDELLFRYTRGVGVCLVSTRGYMDSFVTQSEALGSCYVCEVYVEEEEVSFGKEWMWCCCSDEYKRPASEDPAYQMFGPRATIAS
jgi:hypothetical protein